MTVPPDAGPAPTGRVAYRATAVALGRQHACALLDDGSVKCWGDNVYGQLGLGDTTRRNGPSTLGDALPTVDLGTGRSAVAIAAGRYASCAVLDDGALKCWGWGGLTGITDSRIHGAEPGSMGDALPNLALGPGRTVRMVAIGAYRAFAVLDDGSVKEWSSDAPTEIRAASAAPAVAALTPALGAAAALFEDGRVALLDPKASGGPLVTTPIEEWAAGLPIRAIGGNESTLCLALDTGGLGCNSSGASAFYGVSSSLLVEVATTFGSSAQLACGRRDDGQVICWPGTTERPWWAAPSRPAGETGWLVALDQPAKAIVSGMLDVCAVLADGAVKCWSANPSSAYGLPGDARQGEVRTGPWLPVDLGEIADTSAH